MLDGATKGFVQAFNTQNAVDSAFQVVVATYVVQDANDKQQLVPMTLAVVETTGRFAEKESADSGYCSSANLTNASLRNVDLYVSVDRERHHTNEKSAVIEQIEQTVPAAAATDSVETHNESMVSAEPTPPPQNATPGVHLLITYAAMMVSCTVLSACHPILALALRTAKMFGDLKFLTSIQLMQLKLSTPEGKAEYAKRKSAVEPAHGQVKEVQRARRFQFRGLQKVNCEWRLIMMGHNILKLFRHARDKVLELIRPAESPCYSG